MAAGEKVVGNQHPLEQNHVTSSAIGITMLASSMNSCVPVLFNMTSYCTLASCPDRPSHAFQHELLKAWESLNRRLLYSAEV